MSAAQSSAPSFRYHAQAFKFVHTALRYTQERLGLSGAPEAAGHVTGRELLEGIREIGRQQFGLLCPLVFRSWGVRSTGDFGRLVYQMIDLGEMRKSADDQLSDFFDVYDFDQAFNAEYTLDMTEVFSRN